MVKTITTELRKRVVGARSLKTDSLNNTIKVEGSLYNLMCMFDVRGNVLLKKELKWGSDFELDTKSFKCGTYVVVFEGACGMDSYRVEIQNT